MLYFIDESGPGNADAPHEVLAGVSIAQEDLWNLVQAIRSAEIEFFNTELSREVKAREMLKRKRFRLANQMPPIPEQQRRILAGKLLEKGVKLSQGEPTELQTREEITAYSQAVLAFVHKLFDLCAQFRVKCFASVVKSGAPRPEETGYLRKDYAYLFERFYYHLEDLSPNEIGLIVFDEREKAQSRILLDQMESYFLKSEKGKLRSAKIVPQPFFVHSDLTTGIQLADLAAYCVNTGCQFSKMQKPRRKEMLAYGKRVNDLRYIGKKLDDGNEWAVYGFTYLDDLRPKPKKIAG